MQQYLDLLKTIQEKGTDKPAARPGMPGSKSLFGYQFRHNLQDGFPLLTTKKVNFKSIVVELLWFLRGDTNVRYLIQNGVNIWTEDAYNFYQKHLEKYHALNEGPSYHLFEDLNQNCLRAYTLEEFKEIVGSEYQLRKVEGYSLGDCGYQYGRVWRNWNTVEGDHINRSVILKKTDQITSLIKGLKSNPESRRHIVTAVDPAHDDQLALYWCHSMFQFNCRPLSHQERVNILNKTSFPDFVKRGELVDEADIPKYYLDCQMYQRSADVFLGVPYNIASYALLTHIIAKICNMVAGDFVHTFGDVHIYDNHVDQVEEQLSRTPSKLPELMFADHLDFSGIDELLSDCSVKDFMMWNYTPAPAIKAKLSTGLQ